ncbi:MAG: ornithine carbamoyltransferase [Candidatus Tyrphobacter sp.]
MAPTLLAQRDGPSLAGRHLLEITDFEPRELERLLHLSAYLKVQGRGAQRTLLRDRTLAMLFEKPSLRTRVSFEVAMTQLGGGVLFAQGGEFMVGTRETPEDAARVLSRYVDAIVIRTHAHEPLQRFAAASGVPVVNALSARAHPCQALSDMLTLQERFGSIAGLRIAYLGDARNNVASSLAEAALSLGASVSFGCPSTHRPSESYLAKLGAIGERSGASIAVTSSAQKAASEADVLYTDVWTSMGEERYRERNDAMLRPYAVTEELFAHANPRAVFMHCLPAHRGEETVAAVIDGPRSIVFDQAENRMHAQKALLVALLTEMKGLPV